MFWGGLGEFRGRPFFQRQDKVKWMPGKVSDRAGQRRCPISRVGGWRSSEPVPQEWPCGVGRRYRVMRGEGAEEAEVFM